MFHLSYWLVRTLPFFLCRGPKPPEAVAFSTEALPLNRAVPAERPGAL
jgi:hypothetical protein